MVWFVPLLKALAGKGAAAGAAKGAASVAGTGGAAANAGAAVSRIAPAARAASSGSSMASVLGQATQSPMMSQTRGAAQPVSRALTPTQTSWRDRLQQMQQQGGQGGGGQDDEQARLDAQAASYRQELLQMMAEGRSMRDVLAMAAGGQAIRNPYLTGGR